MKQASKRTRMMAVVLIGTAVGLFSAGYLYLIRMCGQGEVLYSVRNASDHLLPLFTQNVLTNVFPVFLLLLAAILLKNEFPTAMCLKIQGRKQTVGVAVLSVVLGIMTISAAVIKKDAATILYEMFYYLVFVAMIEELIFRGLCSYLLRDCTWKVRYLLPSVIFAMVHLFAYNNFGALTWEYVLSFATSNLLGLLVMGCAFQFLKEKSGTLWIPILLHAIFDFAGVFTY